MIIREETGHKVLTDKTVEEFSLDDCVKGSADLVNDKRKTTVPLSFLTFCLGPLQPTDLMDGGKLFSSKHRIW